MVGPLANVARFSSTRRIAYKYQPETHVSAITNEMTQGLEKMTGTPAYKAKVLIVDDHPIVRQGIAQIINYQPDLFSCCEAGDALEALGALNHCDHPHDLAIIDISLGSISGIELIKALRVRHASLPVLVMSMHDELLYAERVLRAGAQGYIMKQAPTDQVLAAIHQVLRGEIYLSPAVREKILQQRVDPRNTTTTSPIDGLSDRELEVLRLIGLGLSTRDIAETLHRSMKTIETHRARLKTKLKLGNTTQLVHFAVHWVETYYH